MGMVLSAYGKNAAAELFFKRARMLEPEEFRWAYYLAVARQYLGRYEESASAFREALTIDPDSIEARIQLAGVLFEINETARSIELYQEITTEFPERIDAWLGLGKALDRSGDPDAAFNALRRAKDIGPQFGDVRFALAAVLRARGDHEGAARELAAYEKRARVTINTSDQYTTAVVRLNVSDQPLLSKADYQIARGQFGEAVRFFRQALEINPENQDAWGGLVYSLARTGDKDATAEGYREALAAGIRYKRLHFAYGEALRKWKQFDAAREVIGKATELDPQYTEALL
ncbi:MAG: tetratricopeptide repeat protein, partial [Altererythrobacter sp.]|nr:tetratricopeptide repeat protein [Altererythrobacter sp.]